MHKKILNSFLAIALLVGITLWPIVAHAAGTSFSMVANKATVANGGSLIVALYMNGGGTPINAMQLDLTFPASKLQYIGFSAGGSAFEIAASNSGGDGFASIARGTTGSVSGSGLIGTVTFKALASSGSAAINVAGSSALVNANDNSSVPYASYGVSVNFGAVAAAPAAAAPAPEPVKDTTAPVITLIKNKAVTPFSASVTWTTNEDSDSVVEYGLDTNYGLSASASTRVTAHEVALSSAFIQPKVLLHYHVKSADEAGNVQVSPDQTLAIPGVPLTIIVLGADGKPQAGATVTVDNESGTTDDKGSVTLPTSLGNKRVTTSFNGVTLQKPVTVQKTNKPLPPVKLALSRAPVNRWMLTSAGLLFVVIVLVGIDALLFGSKLFARLIGVKLLPATLTHHGHTLGMPTEAAEPAVIHKTNEVAEPTAKATTPTEPHVEFTEHNIFHFPASADEPLDLKAAGNLPLSELVQRNGSPKQVDTTVPVTAKTITVISNDEPQAVTENLKPARQHSTQKPAAHRGARKPAAKKIQQNPLKFS